MLGFAMAQKKNDIDVFTYERPSKSESLLCRLNLGSPDHGQPIGGSKGGGLTPGQIAAALVIGNPQLPSASRLIGHNLSRQAMVDLCMAKHTGDHQAIESIRRYALQLMAYLLTENKPGMKALMEEIRENRGVMRSCCDTAIDDVCRPHLYSGLSDRAWARKIGLENHKLWKSRWSYRYQNLRAVLQELDGAAEEQINRRI